MAAKLGTGDPFPRLTFQLVDGRSVALPEGVDGRYKIVLFYRGHW
jgi:hypothetical protein